MKKKDGMLKTEKLFKAGMIAGAAGLCFAALSGIGLLAESITSMSINTGKRDFLNEASSVPAYQEYYLEEKGKLDEDLINGEITIHEYEVKFDGLQKEMKENFVAEHGSGEQKEELQNYNDKLEVADKVGKGFGLAAVPGLGVAVAGAAVTGKSLNKLKRASQEDENDSGIVLCGE